MASDKRFIEIFTEGTFAQTKILLDTLTGINYLIYANGYAGGITVLLNADGTPVVSPVDIYRY